MVKFYGYELELDMVREVGDIDGIRIRAATDPAGGEWLIVPVDSDLDHLVWVCAPVSTRALEHVSQGRAKASDVVRHSLTGTVDVVTVDHGRSVPDRCVLCADLPPELLPRPAAAVSCAA